MPYRFLFYQRWLTPHERMREAVGQRVLVTTLTKRMAEDLAEYCSEVGTRWRPSSFPHEIQ